MKKETIVHFTSNNKDIKCAVVERFNRSLKSRMFKYFTSKGNRKFLDILDDLVLAYNNSIHRTKKMKSVDVNGENSNRVFHSIYGVKSIDELKQKRSKILLSPKTLVRKQYIFTPFDIIRIGQIKFSKLHQLKVVQLNHFILFPMIHLNGFIQNNFKKLKIICIE